MNKYKRLAAFSVLLPFLFTTVHAQSKKPVVAIGPIQLAAQNISCDGWDRNCNEDLAFGFRQMLETSITKTRKTNRLLSFVPRMEDKIDEVSRAKAAADFYGESNAGDGAGRQHPAMIPIS